MQVLNSMGNQMECVTDVRVANSRLSIIVPLEQNEAVMEATLISVLENRPLGAEILLCHDGSYEDPYDLCDEVKLVTATSAASGSPSTVDLVRAGVWAASGPWTHVITSGLRATAGWADAALEAADQDDCGSIAAVVRQTDDRRLAAAGWVDSLSGLCKPASAGKATVKVSSRQSVGAYVGASFWRTALLRSLTRAFHGHDMITTGFAFHSLSQQAGWRCVLADQCELLCDDETVLLKQPGFARGRQLRGLRNHFHDDSMASRLASMTLMAIAGLTRPGRLGEAMGNAMATLGGGSVDEQPNSQHVMQYSPSPQTHRLPSREDSRVLQAA